MRVREFRMLAALSQAELAERAGLSEAAIKKLESPKSKRPYPQTIRKVAAALGVEPRQLIVLEPGDTPIPPL